MKKIYLIRFISRVKGSNEPWGSKGIAYACKKHTEALEDCKKLNLKRNNDKFLEFRYFVEAIDLY